MSPPGVTQGSSSVPFRRSPQGRAPKQPGMLILQQARKMCPIPQPTPRGMPGVRRCCALSLFPSFPLFPSPALGQTTAPRLGTRDLRSAEMKVGVHRVCVPCYPMSLGLPHPTALLSLCRSLQGGKASLHLYVEESKCCSAPSKCMEGCLQACNFYGCFILL